jgi:two-component system, response regulator YesN
MYTVLLVDDDRSMLYMLRRYKGWSEHGFVISGEACDGREALALLNEKKIDLILSDIKMPGMDGMELVKELSRLEIDCTVVFLSTVGDFEHARQGIRLGVFDYLLKPFDEQAIGDVLNRVKDQLDEQYLHEAKSKFEKRKSEDILGLYVPREAVAELSSALLSGNRDDTMLAAEKTYDEILKVFGEDDLKTEALIQVVLVNTGEKICSANPFISKVEKLTFENIFQQSCGNADQRRHAFLSQIARLSDIVQKYELERKESVIRSICTFVLDHAEEPLTLEAVANEVHFRGDYVGKLFKKKTGRRLSEYITAIKMEHAKYLLRTGDYKNYELCEKLSYNDSDYFCSLFKKHTGMTPNEYKNCV